jgi:hypothetical protein
MYFSPSGPRREERRTAPGGTVSGVINLGCFEGVEKSLDTARTNACATIWYESMFAKLGLSLVDIDDFTEYLCSRARLVQI